MIDIEKLKKYEALIHFYNTEVLKLPDKIAVSEKERNEIISLLAKYYKAKNDYEEYIKMLIFKSER